MSSDAPITISSPNLTSPHSQTTTIHLSRRFPSAIFSLFYVQCGYIIMNFANSTFFRSNYFRCALRSLLFSLGENDVI